MACTLSRMASLRNSSFVTPAFSQLTAVCQPRLPLHNREPSPSYTPPNNHHAALYYEIPSDCAAGARAFFLHTAYNIRLLPALRPWYGDIETLPDPDTQPDRVFPAKARYGGPLSQQYSWGRPNMLCQTAFPVLPAYPETEFSHPDALLFPYNLHASDPS